ncbi:hypothetical protein EDB83DRAFT_2519052 [Lactarius deliciosus]|nr:hypothetical protein EDB83DRAFT_2519052 [Lactarius deliciosus]
MPPPIYQQRQGFEQYPSQPTIPKPLAPFHDSVVQNQQVPSQFLARTAQESSVPPYTDFQASQQRAIVSTGPKFIPQLTQIDPVSDDDLYERGPGPLAATTTVVKDEQKNKRGSKKSPEKGKERQTTKVKGGRQHGATNFGETATVELLKIVEKHLPIGSGGWEAVKKEYNEFATENNQHERDIRSLKQKFDKLVNTAMEKPTGEANRSLLLEAALRVHEKLQNKSGTAVLLDGDTSEEEREAKGKARLGVANAHEIIHLTSDGDSNGEGELKGSKKGKAVKSNFVVKAYQTANPLETKTRKAQVSSSQAADTIAAIGSYFSPERVRERDDSSLNLFQFQSTLTELREVRLRNEQLQDTLNLETRRADRLENQTSNLKEKIDELKAKVRELKDDIRFMKRTRHRRHLDSDSDSDSPRERHRRQRRSTPVPENKSDAHESP